MGACHPGQGERAQQQELRRHGRICQGPLHRSPHDLVVKRRIAKPGYFVFARNRTSLRRSREIDEAIAKTSRQHIAEAVDVPAQTGMFVDVKSVSTIGFDCQYKVLLLIQKYYGWIKVPFFRGVLLRASDIESSGTVILVLIENRIHQRHRFVPLACT